MKSACRRGFDGRNAAGGSAVVVQRRFDMARQIGVLTLGAMNARITAGRA